MSGEWGKPAEATFLPVLPVNFYTGAASAALPFYPAGNPGGSGVPCRLSCLSTGFTQGKLRSNSGQPLVEKEGSRDGGVEFRQGSGLEKQLWVQDTAIDHARPGGWTEPFGAGLPARSPPLIARSFSLVCSLPSQDRPLFRTFAPLQTVTKRLESKPCKVPFLIPS
jgi:hypothetical protein